MTTVLGASGVSRKAVRGGGIRYASCLLTGGMWCELRTSTAAPLSEPHSLLSVVNIYHTVYFQGVEGGILVCKRTFMSPDVVYMQSRFKDDQRFIAPSLCVDPMSFQTAARREVSNWSGGRLAAPRHSFG